METANECHEPKPVPSLFQRRAMWGAITALSIVAIGAIAVGMVMLSATVLSYLQPILVPLAVAAIIAYLLEPIIAWLMRRGWSHRSAMLSVYIAFIVLVILLVVAVVVPTFGQAQEVYEKREAYGKQITNLVKRGITSLQENFNAGIAKDYTERGVEWISAEGPKIAGTLGQWIWTRLRGAFGFFGYLLGLLLVPIYLYYFLQNGHTIAKSWSDYLPLKASTFKDEVVGTLTEINGYLISFFRGQMVVSLIDGALVALVLSFVVQLPYGLLIGVFLAILGLIPYIGNLLVMIPAMLIAIAHFGATSWGEVQGTLPAVAGETALVLVETEKTADTYFVTQVSEDGTRAEVLLHAWTWLPTVWAYPLIVLAIFVIFQQINGLVTAPKIVGDSVGLHPLTVIFSVIFWSFLLGGLLGALLAVPLTAAIKVLFRRYLWERRLEAVVERRLSGLGGGGDEGGEATADPDDARAIPAGT